MDVWVCGWVDSALISRCLRSSADIFEQKRRRVNRQCNVKRVCAKMRRDVLEYVVWCVEVCCVVLYVLGDLKTGGG